MAQTGEFLSNVKTFPICNINGTKRLTSSNINPFPICNIDKKLKLFTLLQID